MPFLLAWGAIQLSFRSSAAGEAHAATALQALEAAGPAPSPEAIIRAGILVVKAGGGKRRLAQMEHTRELLSSIRYSQQKIDALIAQAAVA